MGMIAFIVITTFLVVGINSLVPYDTNWETQCRQELGDSWPFMDDSITETRIWCAMACILEKAGAIKDGKPEHDKIIDIFEQQFSKHRTPDGRTIRELAERCYDEAKTRTDKCEVVSTMTICLSRATAG